MNAETKKAARDKAKAYCVERDDSRVCPYCARGAVWDVIGPGDIAEGISFTDEGDAEEYCAALNAAFEKGQVAASTVNSDDDR